MTDAVAAFQSAEPHHEEGVTGSYLDSHGRGLGEWLLTTDHKRIALLYAAMITAFFFVGGAAATLIRLELFSPTARFLTDDGYNRAFSLHGVIMVWFFLVPLIPTTLGNFLLPLMIGAPDVAFPKLNLASWYLTLIGGLFVLAAMATGGLDTGWTFYPPYSPAFAHRNVAVAVTGVIVAGFGTIATGVNFVATTHTLRAPGMTWFRLPLLVWALYATSLVMILATPVLAMMLGPLVRPAGVRRLSRRRPAAFPAPLLVLLASSSLHDDPAGVRGHHGGHCPLRAQTRVRLYSDGLLDPCDRDHRLRRLGAPHVRVWPVGLREPRFFVPLLHGRRPVGDQGVQLDGDALPRPDYLRRADARRTASTPRRGPDSPPT
jgi:hypothetical protein